MTKRLSSTLSPNLLIVGLALCQPALVGAAGPVRLTVAGHDRRCDLRWEFDQDGTVDGYLIHRAAAPDGVATVLNPSPQRERFFSDFIGVNDVARFYRVTAVKAGVELAGSALVAARTRAMTDDELLTSVQAATFR